MKTTRISIVLPEKIKESLKSRTRIKTVDVIKHILQSKIAYVDKVVTNKPVEQTSLQDLIFTMFDEQWRATKGEFDTWTGILFLNLEVIK